MHRAEEPEETKCWDVLVFFKLQCALQVTEAIKLTELPGPGLYISEASLLLGNTCFFCFVFLTLLHLWSLFEILMWSVFSSRSMDCIATDSVRLREFNLRLLTNSKNTWHCALKCLE